MRKLVVLLAVLSSLVSCTKKTEETTLVARVGDHKISVAAFTRSYFDIIKWTPVNVQDSPALRKQHLNDLITRHFIAQKAIEANIQDLPAFKNAMKAESTAVVIHGLYEDEIGKQLAPISDAELEEAFKRMNLRLNIRHLVSRTKPGIDSLYARLMKGESFESLARECFQDSTLRYTGGDLGYITWNDLDIDLENAAYALIIGEISKPIETKYGWHIIKLENIIYNPILRESDYQIKKKSIENQLRYSLLKNKADKRIKEMMTEKNVQMNVPLIALFEKERRMLNATMIKNKVDSLEIFTGSLRNLFETHQTETIAAYDGGVWTVGDFKENLHTISPADFEAGIYRAVAMTLRNYFLLQTAKEKRIDKIESVKNQINEKRERLLATAYLDIYADTCSFNDQDLLYYYDQMKDKQYFDKKMTVLEILVSSEAQARELINKILSANNDEKLFRELARNNTIRPGMKEKDGYLGIIGKEDFGDIGKRCFNVNKGGVTGPIRTKDGYSIVMVLNYEKVYSRFDDVKNDILKYLEERKRDAAFQKLKRHYAGHPEVVVYDETLLKSF